MPRGIGGARSVPALPDAPAARALAPLRGVRRGSALFRCRGRWGFSAATVGGQRLRFQRPRRLPARPKPRRPTGAPFGQETLGDLQWVLFRRADSQNLLRDLAV